MKRFVYIIGGAIVLAIATGAAACGFHSYSPQPTLVDRLIASDQIVLARSVPSNPFRFEPTEIIKGHAGTVPEIPFLVDSSTRRTFRAQRQAQVLFARNAEDQSWARVAMVNSAMAPVAEKIFSRLPDWAEGQDDDRLSVFAALLDHPNDAVHAVALRELDLVDYQRLRQTVSPVDAERLLTRLNAPSERDLLPIRVLLLGLSGTAELKQRFHSALTHSLRFGSEHIGAYATALIELGGVEAIHAITVEFLINHDLPASARETLLQAMALHSSGGRPVLDEAISNAILTALWLDSGLAGPVARQFGAVADWRHGPAITAALQEGAALSITDQRDVDSYLRSEKPIRRATGLAQLGAAATPSQ